jgi:hypothetical protein
MAESTIETMRRVNVQLRERLKQFRSLIDGMIETETWTDAIDQKIRSWIINSMAPAEIGPHLREIALRCISLAREDADERTIQAMENISVVLADCASSLEAIFRISDDHERRRPDAPGK